MEKMIIPFSPPDISEEEIEAVSEVLRSGWITTGPKTKQFEQELAQFVGTSKAVCLNSATACLECILRVLGIGEGDEVITSAYTYTASASPVIHVGANLKLIDTQADSYEMDYDALAAAITPKTKVIIPVDIAGVPCDYDRIFRIVKEKQSLFTPSNELQRKYNRVIVVADAAHALGAARNGIKVGNIADFTSFSFHAVKNLTTAEGGAITWRNTDGIDAEELYKQFMILSLHGQTKDALSKNQVGGWEYDIVSPAYKCNMTDIMAAIGLVQLKRYPQFLKRRQEMAKKYDEALSQTGCKGLAHNTDTYTSSGHLYLLQLKKADETVRNSIINKLATRGIATNVHYKPLPMLTAYRNLGFSIEDYPNAKSLYSGEITLPLYTKLTDAEIEYVIRNLLEVLDE